MKKLYSLFISILIALSIVFTGAHSVKANAVSVDDYYSAASTSSGEALARTLHSIISSGTKDIGYDGLLRAYRDTDCKPGTNIIWDMYSNEEFVCGGPKENHDYKKEGDGYNREHSVPQSWFGKKSPMKSDLFHVYPTDGYVNNRRGNLPYGEVDGATYTSENGSKVGSSALSGYTGTVFEPIDEYKGDFARTYFYMAIRYSNQLGSWGSGADVVFKGSYPYLTKYSIDLFTKWHMEDPVSEKEINRNNAAYEYQKNRNPFIDHPEWSTIIWGGTYGGGSVTTTYSVNYVVPEGATFNYRDAQRYEANSTITMPDVTPIKEGYTFDAWYSDQTYTTKWNFASNTINKNLTLYARMNIDETQLPSIFTRDTKMEVALGINYSKVSSGSATTTAVSRTVELGFNGSFGSNNIEKNTSADINKNVIAKDDTNISELFDFSYEDTGKGNIYISGGKIRLYYLPSGKGSKLVVRAKDGVKISDIAATSTSSGCLCKVSSDGKEAYIQASTAKEGGNFEFTGFTVKYETNSASYSYQVNKVDLKARYLIPEEIYNLITKNQSDVKYFMSFNDTKTQCQVVKEGHYYVVMAQINTDSLDTKYNIVGTIVIGNTTYTTKQITYSARDIAKKLVLEYGEDILDIENLSQVLYEMIPDK